MVCASARGSKWIGRHICTASRRGTPPSGGTTPTMVCDASSRTTVSPTGMVTFSPVEGIAPPQVDELDQSRSEAEPMTSSAPFCVLAALVNCVVAPSVFLTVSVVLEREKSARPDVVSSHSVPVTSDS